MQTFTRVCAFLALPIFAASAAQPALPVQDQRAREVRTLNTLRTFPEIASRAEWEKRAQAIREQAMVSCGLWPLPERTPLNARVFDRVERDGYTVEKVYFQSYPGFYVAGNLYRPLGKKGPFPAVLNPHGHWANGRLADTHEGSIVARCITQARMGMVAFSWDMIGYNDTQFARPAGEPGYKTHRNFANDPTNQLWNISQMGLQTWNAVRALDFLLSLPDVDTNRVACTGESGGGTQTFMLGAIDDRLTVQAPIVMVSHSMQGGCSCENVAGLRVDYSNMEFAAQPAPRPQILVAATGDWTRATLKVEGPAIERVYRLFNAPERLRYVLLDFNHNYNEPSREAVYGFFNRWVLNGELRDNVDEPPYKKEPDAALRVFPDGKLPGDAVTQGQLTEYLIREATNHLWKYAPVNPPLLQRYRQEMLTAWKRNLQVEFIDRGLMVQPGKMVKGMEFTTTHVTLGRAGRGDVVPAAVITPRRDTSKLMAVLVNEQGRAAFMDAAGSPKGLARLLVENNVPVLLLDTFLTGDARTNAPAKPRNYFNEFYTTYNRTELQERVQDIVTACAYAQAQSKGRKIVLCGTGRAGLWAMLAAPAADVMVADCVAFDSSDDRNFLAPDLFAPGLRKMGGFEGVLAMNVTNPLFLHNTGTKFSTAYIRRAYTGMHIPEMFREEPAAVTDEDIARWIAELRVK